MSGGDWAAVAVAGSLLAVMVGVLCTLPIWTRPSGPRLVSALLTVHAGGTLVAATIATAAAVRSWQLLDRPADAAVTPTLLTVSRVDGNGSMYALIILAVVGVGALATLLLMIAARFASASDPTERMIACAVLGLEVGLCGYGLAAFLGGSRSAPALLGVVNLPLVMAAMVRCWPPHANDPLADSTT